MDYKYIEQLLESYFDCGTTLQEEQILRSFFSQENVPAHLAQYAPLFNYESEAASESLGDDFDRRMLDHVASGRSAGTGERSVRGLVRHIAPFFKAVAVVAVALTIGQAAERAIGGGNEAEEAEAVAIDPYVKTSDVQQAIRVRDVSQAEAKAAQDSLVNVSASGELR